MEIYTANVIKDEILEAGNYKGYYYVIRTLGKYPCAYVALKSNMSFDETENLTKPYLGITYTSYDYGRLPCLSGRYNWIGWDYRHCIDYNASIPDFGGQKHTLEEIESNVKEVIDELIEQGYN